MPHTVNRKTLRSWSEELEAVGERIAPHFLRSELRGRAQAYLRGLLSGAERKNSWQLAEVAGNATPYGIQHLLDEPIGTPTPCATNSEAMCSSAWRTMRAF